jgi:hypothetical protein
MSEHTEDSFAQMSYHLQQVWYLEQKIERLSRQLKFEKLAYQKELIKLDIHELSPKELDELKKKQIEDAKKKKILREEKKSKKN